MTGETTYIPGQWVAGPHTWNHSDVLEWLRAGGAFDIEQDNYGNIVIYPALHEDQAGYLTEGTVNEEGAVA